MPMSNAVKIRQLFPETPDAEVEAAIAVVTEAFETNGYSSFILRGHTELQPAMNRALVKAGLAGGKVYVAELNQDESDHEIIGTAVWFGPGEGLMRTEAQFDAGFKEYVSKLAETDEGLLGWLMEKFLPEYESFLVSCYGPSEDGYKLNGWGLEWFGVKKAYQGKGIGRSMIEWVKPIITQNPDQSTWHITLDTDDDDARSFYRKLGFAEKGSKTFQGMDKLNTSLTMYGLALEVAKTE